jgi:hypothetical protein
MQSVSNSEGEEEEVQHLTQGDRLGPSAFRQYMKLPRKVKPIPFKRLGILHDNLANPWSNLKGPLALRKFS